MARIENVDYKTMPSQANEMRGEAKLLNKELNLAYEGIKGMHEVWYGKRYNELVDGFNDMIPALNDLLTLVVNEIPYTLETIANNYAQVDCGRKVVTPNNDAPQKIRTLEKRQDNGLRFLSADVNSVKQKVSTNFSHAKELMDKIETIYSKVTWKSDASEQFRTKFKTLKNQIVASFEKINTQFNKLMKQTEQDMEIAEKANKI